MCNILGSKKLSTSIISAPPTLDPVLGYHSYLYSSFLRVPEKPAVSAHGRKSLKYFLSILRRIYFS